MHRFKSASPRQDTEHKLGALGKRLRGRVCDVCTGLGYTAIGAAQCEAVSEVCTIELDPLMVDMQRANPWSESLFSDPKMVRLLGDATEVVAALPTGYFDALVHDPPAQVNLANRLPLPTAPYPSPPPP